jgi:hypothetical protein
MAVRTTFFLCRASELAAGFPDWKPPLPEPVLRKIKSPLTGGFLTIPSLVPEWPDEQKEISELSAASANAFAVEGENFESRLPPIVRDRPRWTANDIGTFCLERLSDVVGAPATLECPLYGPPSCGDMLVEIPEFFLAKLKSLDASNLVGVAEKWADALKPPDDIEPIEGEPIEEPWSAEFALTILEPIVGLAWRAEGEERMYLFVEG